MNGINGYPRRPSIRLILAFVDYSLILIGVLMSGYLRFPGGDNYYFLAEYSALKIIMLVLVIQIAFYFFDLYEFKNFRARIRTSILLLESFAISFLLLAIVFYSIPALTIGRGILTISLILVFLLVFLWRLIFSSICRKSIKERILIVGTGDLSKKITQEIIENGHDAFEIIGFVAE